MAKNVKKYKKKSKAERLDERAFSVHLKNDVGISSSYNGDQMGKQSKQSRSY